MPDDLTMTSSIDEIIHHITNNGMKSLLRIQTTLIKSIEDFMISKDFIQLLPVITSKITDPLGPDPQTSVKMEPKIKYYDQNLVLTQSMIFHKQLALLGGMDKIFIMSPNIRLEDTSRGSTGRHLFEFTQMDFEIAHGTMRDVMRLMEELIKEVLTKIMDKHSKDLETLDRTIEIPLTSFKVYTSYELEAEYGLDWEIKASKDHSLPFWVTSIEREFYDREDPKKLGEFRNYDLIYPEGYGEALSGGEREFRYDKIITRIKSGGLDPSKFDSFLEIARKGLLIPSAGAGIGMERLLRFITGAKHIGEIQLFRRVPGEIVIV